MAGARRKAGNSGKKAAPEKSDRQLRSRKKTGKKTQSQSTRKSKRNISTMTEVRTRSDLGDAPVSASTSTAAPTTLTPAPESPGIISATGPSENTPALPTTSGTTFEVEVAVVPEAPASANETSTSNFLVPPVPVTRSPRQQFIRLRHIGVIRRSTSPSSPTSATFSISGPGPRDSPTVSSSSSARLLERLREIRHSIQRRDPPPNNPGPSPGTSTSDTGTGDRTEFRPIPILPPPPGAIPRRPTSTAAPVRAITFNDPPSLMDHLLASSRNDSSARTRAPNEISDPQLPQRGQMLVLTASRRNASRAATVSQGPPGNRRPLYLNLLDPASVPEPVMVSTIDFPWLNNVAELMTVDGGGGGAEPKYLSIDVEEVSTLFAFKRLVSYLVVDIRDFESFTAKRLQLSIHAHLALPEGSNAGSVKFLSKKDVMKYLLQNCPGLVAGLKSPGCFTDIIVYDQSSKAEAPSDSISILIDAIIKWNESTRTNVRMLQGGCDRFLDVDFISSGPVVRQQTHLLTDVDASTLSAVELSNLNGINAYYKDKAATIEAKAEKILLMKRKRSYEAIRTTLLEEEKNDHLDNAAPEDAKCPVCFSMFIGRIFQCANGHSVCGACSPNLNHCPECRIAYDRNGGTRNRALEKMLETSFKLDCPYTGNGCREQMTHRQILDHMKVCKFIQKSEEVAKLDEGMEAISGELLSVNQLLTQIGNVKWNVSFNDYPGLNKQKDEEMCKLMGNADSLMSAMYLEESFPDESVVKSLFK